MTIRRPVLKETLMFYDPLSGYANESSWEAETETKNRPKMLKQNIIYILFFLMCRVVYGWVIEQRLITTDLSHLLLFVYFLTRCPIGVERCPSSV